MSLSFFISVYESFYVHSLSFDIYTTGLFHLEIETE